jgi:hypothetical protein
MYYTIYKISNKINGKVYIGSHKTKNLDDGYMGSGKYLKHAQEKHGIKNFTKEILFVYDTPEKMYAKEAELVNEDFLAIENTYNLKVGGFGGFDYINSKGFIRNSSHFDIGNKKSEKGGFITFIECKGIHSKESKLKAGEIVKERFPRGTFYGKKHSEEVKRGIGEKNSKSQIGKNNSQFGTIWINNGIENAKAKNCLAIPDGWKKGRI